MISTCCSPLPEATIPPHAKDPADGGVFLTCLSEVQLLASPLPISLHSWEF